MMLLIIYLGIVSTASAIPQAKEQGIQKSFLEEFDESSGGGFVHKTTKVELLSDGAEKTSKTTEIHKKKSLNGTEDVDMSSVETYKYPNGTIMRIEKHGEEEKVIGNVNCTEDEHCDAQSFCNLLQYTCVNCRSNESTCDRNAQCCQGTKCLNGTCKEYKGAIGESCQSSADCLPGHCCAAGFAETICKPIPGDGESCGQEGLFGIPLFGFFKTDSSIPSSCPCQDGLKCMKQRSHFFMGGKVCSVPRKTHPSITTTRQHKKKTKRSSLFLPDDEPSRPSFLDTVQGLLERIFGEED